MVPSSFPRVTVVITPEQHALLNRLGVLTRRSAASYVRQLLDTAQPALERILAPLEAAAALQARFDDDLGQEASKWLSEEQAALDGQMSLLDHAGFVDGEASPPATDGEEVEGGEAPPSSNTGVRSKMSPIRSPSVPTKIRSRVARKHG